MNWKPLQRTPIRSIPSSWMNLTTSTASLISSSKIFAQNLIPSHGTDGLRQGRTLGHQAECTPGATGVMPALSSRNTGGVFLWHFLVSKVHGSSVPVHNSALCRLLIIFFFPCRLQKFWFGWIAKEAVNSRNNWSCLKSCFQSRALAYPIPTFGHTQSPLKAPLPSWSGQVPSESSLSCCSRSTSVWHCPSGDTQVRDEIPDTFFGGRREHNSNLSTFWKAGALSIQLSWQ